MESVSSYIVLRSCCERKPQYVGNPDYQGGFRTTHKIDSAKRFLPSEMDDGIVAAIEYLTQRKWAFVEVCEDVKTVQIKRRTFSAAG